MPNPTGRKVQGGAAVPVYILGSEDGVVSIALALGETITLGSGEAYIGETGGPGTTISVTPTVTAGAYGAGDVVGGLLEFEDAARVEGKGGVVIGATIVDDAGQDSEMELWLFNAEPTAIADNDAFSMDAAEAELHTVAGILSTADSTWRAAGTPSVVYMGDYVRYDPESGTSLYAFLVDRTGGTLAATDDITVILHVLQD